MDGFTHSRGGGSYNIFFQNCQGFATKILRYLKECQWTSDQRLQHKFNLADLEAYVKSGEDSNDNLVDVTAGGYNVFKDYMI